MLILEGKTVLAIAPHIDDVELGCGATIHRLCAKNDVYYLGMSLPPLVGRETFMAEFREAVSIIGIRQDRIMLRDYDPRNLFEVRSEILQWFYDLNKELKPDL